MSNPPTLPPPPPQSGRFQPPAPPGNQSRSDRFAAAKSGNLFSTSPLPSSSTAHGQPRPGSGIGQRNQSIVSSQPVTAEELGVKFVDIGKTDITEEDRAGWRSFRQKVANEILTTERSYVNSLNMMLKAYHDPYFEGQKTGLTEKKVASLFTLPKVIITVANSFLAEVELHLKNWDTDETIAPVFVKYYPMFRTYRDYSSAHQQNITVILGKINSRSAFTSFQEKQMKALGCHDLASYLITPIQRLPRYKLLLESLLSKTESTHPQAQALLQALKNINEVATSVNDAMKAAQLVDRYMHVQRMFGPQGELVHLWRKLLVEFPCKVTRVWQSTSPGKEAPGRKDAKEKKEKKHRFVTNDAVLFLFTDCIWLGIKTKDREQKYEESRNAPAPYPLYGNEFSMKFSLLTLGVHNLATAQSFPQPATLGDYTYFHSITLTSPLHAVCLTFPDFSQKEAALKIVTSTMREFEALCRTRTLTTSQFFDTPSNGNYKELLCCDRCSYGLFTYQKLGEIGAYNLHHDHLICNKCQGIVCTECLHNDPMFETRTTASAPKAGLGLGLPGLSGGIAPVTPSTAKSPAKLNQLLGGNTRVMSYQIAGQYATVSSEGFGVCPATGRWCSHCQQHPTVPVFDKNVPGVTNISPGPSSPADRYERDDLRKSHVGPQLSASDFTHIRSRQTTNNIGLRVNLMDGDPASPGTPSVSTPSQHSMDSLSQTRPEPVPSTQTIFKPLDSNASGPNSPPLGGGPNSPPLGGGPNSPPLGGGPNSPPFGGGPNSPPPPPHSSTPSFVPHSSTPSFVSCPSNLQLAPLTGTGQSTTSSLNIQPMPPIHLSMRSLPPPTPLPPQTPVSSCTPSAPSGPPPPPMQSLSPPPPPVPRQSTIPPPLRMGIPAPPPSINPDLISEDIPPPPPTMKGAISPRSTLAPPPPPEEDIPPPPQQQQQQPQQQQQQQQPQQQQPQQQLPPQPFLQQPPPPQFQQPQVPQSQVPPTLQPAQSIPNSSPPEAFPPPNQFSTQVPSKRDALAPKQNLRRPSI